MGKDAEAGRQWVLKATLRSRLHPWDLSRRNIRRQKKYKEAQQQLNLYFRKTPLAS